MMKFPDDSFFSAVLNAMPSPVFVVDDDVRIIAANLAARPLIGEDASIVYLHRSGEALHCIHSADAAGGCGKGAHCQSCVIRRSVAESFGNKKTLRRAAKMILQQKGKSREVFLLITTAPLKFEGNQYVILTLEDINELVELRRLLPICASCKKIRNEQEYWDSIEAYFKRHLDVDFTHGICPECFERLYPDIAAELAQEKPDWKRHY